MSDSPANRPRRNASFASFFVDEDDFEDNSLKLGKKSKKSNDEDVFVGYDEDDVESEKEIESILMETESDPNPKPKSKPKNAKGSASKSKKPTRESLAKKIVKAEEPVSDAEIDFDEEQDENEEYNDTQPKSGMKPKLPIKKDTKSVSSRPAPLPKLKFPQTASIANASLEKPRTTPLSTGIRRVGLSKSAPVRPLSPVKLKKIE